MLERAASSQLDVPLDSVHRRQWTDAGQKLAGRHGPFSFRLKAKNFEGALSRLDDEPLPVGQQQPFPAASPRDRRWRSAARGRNFEDDQPQRAIRAAVRRPLSA